MLFLKKITRLDTGLPENSFVLCCFNSTYKITSEEFDIWMRIMKTVEDCVLWLFKSNQWAERNLKKEAQNRGVNPNRIIFADRLPQDEHLARHKLADLFIVHSIIMHIQRQVMLFGQDYLL